MIATLHGTLAYKFPEYVIVDVGGVGYKVTVSLNTFARLPSAAEKIFLFIHTAVREDDISLFGFLDEDERRLFQKLISVNGIGPKLAVTILSGIAPHDLVDALHREDVARLTAISGIGRKTAERMILDLKDKLQELLSTDRTHPMPSTGRRRIFEEATSALVNLGYNRAVAERTLSRLALTDHTPLEGVIRQALKLLSAEAAA